MDTNEEQNLVLCCNFESNEQSLEQNNIILNHSKQLRNISKGVGGGGRSLSVL